MAYEVSVQLRNPPNGANKWQIRIVDDVGLRTLIWGLDAHDNIGETAAFILSPDWLFPLSIDIAIYKAWQENSEWHAQQLYRAQSIWPYLWDFDKNDWGDEEDPDYRYIFIPALGSYYYYVDTEEMILTELAPPAQDWTPIIGMVLVLGMVAMLIPTLKGAFK